jgi:hypothetical protein
MEKIRVLDKRRKNFFIVDDEYLNGYAKLCGVSATAVYFSLCRHADKNQTCFPSIKLIAEEHSMTGRTVITATKKLIEWNIIKKTKKRKKNGKWLNNVYVLIDKSDWKNKPSENIALGQPSENNDVSQVKKTTLSQVKSFHTKETHSEVNTYKKTHILISETKVSQVNELIEKFKILNPNYERLFANKTQRSAVERLIKKMGVEKLERAITAASAAQKERYAPTITTPLQLEEKMAQLIVFFQNNKPNKLRKA